MKDTIDLFWSNVQIRVRDPFWGAFSLSWVLSNWKALLFLFYPMDWDLEARLNHISVNLYSPCYSWGLAKVVGFPLGATLLYLLVLPKAINWIDRKYQSMLIDRRNARVILQGRLLITVEDKHALMKDLAETRLELDKARAALVEAGNHSMGRQSEFEAIMRQKNQEIQKLLRDISALRNPHLSRDQVPLPPFDLGEELKEAKDPT